MLPATNALMKSVASDTRAPTLPTTQSLSDDTAATYCVPPLDTNHGPPLSPWQMMPPLAVMGALRKSELVAG